MRDSLYILAVHGSHSPDYHHEVKALVAGVEPYLSGQALAVYLECHELSFAAQITTFLQSEAGKLIKKVELLPLFLLSGVHVCEDLPKALAELRLTWGQDMTFNLHVHLGKYEQFIKSLSQCFADYPHYYRVLFAHGSRQAGANEAIADLSQQFQANPVYWASEPTLTQQLSTLKETDQNIFIQPYFLFSGRIPAAIAEQVNTFRAQYPGLVLGSPLTHYPPIQQAIAKILQSL
jgi:sirohydrochlorin ferrochelatase